MTIQRIAIATIGFLLLLSPCTVSADEQNPTSVETSNANRAAAPLSRDRSPTFPLSREEALRLDAAVDRSLIWLASRQRADGSFPTLDAGQPAVTSLCMMAFMAHGHVPGGGKYGTTLDRATAYVLSCQKENGLMALLGPDGLRIDRNVENDVGVTCAYNHAISSLNLSELYGMSHGDQAKIIAAAVRKALAASLQMQQWPKNHPQDRGGWRYLYHSPNHRESDLSITGWELMFLRSARNAGFDVAKEPIDEAVAYVRRCYSQKYGVFQYVGGNLDNRSRGMAGAGILALAHAGFHKSPEALSNGEWILKHDFEKYNGIVEFNPKAPHERYHYSLFMCCQGMYQVGGRYWDDFFPPTVRTLLQNQQPDGSWSSEVHWRDGQFGNAYTTALVVLSLGAPNQLLPIFQR